VSGKSWGALGAAALVLGCGAGRAPAARPDAAVAREGAWWPAASPSDHWTPVAALLLPTGAIVVADSDQNRLFLLRDGADPPLRLPSPGRAPVQWTALAAAPGLSFYVLDGPGRRIHQYDYQGNYLGTALDLEDVAEAEGLGPLDPAGLAVDRAGHAVVADRLGDRLLVFNPGWAFAGVWGQSGSEPGSWRRPAAVAAGSDGPFLVADEANRRVVLLDGLGEVTAVADLDATPRGVAVLAPGRYAVSTERGVLLLDRGLEIAARLRLPDPGSCKGRPYATAALAGDARSLVVGEGCSGRLVRYPLGGG